MNAVRVRKRWVTMETYSQDPLNPHPVFPQWSPWDVYPYQYWGSVRKYVVRRKYYMPTIENEFLRVTVAADIGGRIWDIYDKIGRRHLANWNTGVRSYNAGFGRNYTTGGIECNYPLAHSCTTSRKREISTAKYPDGSAAIIVSELDRIWRTRWSMTCRLYPNRAFVEQRIKIYNRTPYDSRCMYWNNCGWVLHKDSQFIFPESAGAMHGDEIRTFSYPMWRHRDISFFRQVPDMLGLYMLDPEEPYFGYYDHAGEFGLVHYGDVADLPGKKYWTWGWVPERMEVARRTHHSRGKVYGEVQAGRIVIQEHRDRVPPETECEWRELWYPVRGTGAFNAAGPGAAMRVEVPESSAHASRVRVKAMANGFFPKAKIVVTSDGVAPAEREISLGPLAPVEVALQVKAPAGPDRHTTIRLLSADGETLAIARLRPPRTRDSWREVITVQEDLKPVGAEDLFMAAERKARDWGNHDLRPLYEKVLRQDEAFTPARRELGKWALWQGLHDEAIEHFEVALQRDPNSLESRYFLGVALRNAGRVREARKAFELANRYGWEACSLVRLAELRMREADWNHALRHLERLASAYPRLTRPRGLRAVCLRRLGRTREAEAEIRDALTIDGQDPFLRMEAMFAKTRSMAVAKLPSRSVRDLVEQLRDDEPPLLEATFDYLSAGLFEEAGTVLKIIPRPGPLALFVLAHIRASQGRKAEAVRLLRRACKCDPVGHQMWRLEMKPIMEWVVATLPKNPRPLFHLGNFMMARRRTDEGEQLWRKAERLGERHYLLFANLGFYESRVCKKAARAAAYFRKAARAEAGDLYVKHELFNTLLAAGRRAEAVRFLERERNAVRSSPLLTHNLLTVYLEQNKYEKFDALCSQVDFSPNYQIRGPHNLWLRRHFQEAIQLARNGRLRAAMDILQNLRPAPPHLGVASAKDVEDDRRYYHMGCIHERMGDAERARRCWEKAVALDHGTYYEPGFWFASWNRRYFQALALRKLGRESEANAFFDAMELLARSEDLPAAARQAVMDLVERGRFAPDDEKDPLWITAVKVQTKAEE